MKLVPLLITAAVVIGYNMVANDGEFSTQQMVISGVLAIVVYEGAAFLYRRLKKNQTKP